MPLHTEQRAILARYFINEKSVILDKHRSNHYNCDNSDTKQKTFLQWHSEDLSFVKCSDINNRKTKLNSPLQCIQCSFSPGGFDRLIWVVLWRSSSTSLLPMSRHFVMWSYLDHKLKLRVKMSKWRTETEKLCISEVISYVIILTMIRKTRLLPNDIPQSYLSSIVPTFIKEKPNCNHHFSVSSVVWRHVDSTVWFGWCFEEAVPLRFSKCNHNFFYGHSLIKNSNWE